MVCSFGQPCLFFCSWTRYCRERLIRLEEILKGNSSRRGPTQVSLSRSAEIAVPGWNGSETLSESVWCYDIWPSFKDHHYLVCSPFGVYDQVVEIQSRLIALRHKAYSMGIQNLRYLIPQFIYWIHHELRLAIHPSFFWPIFRWRLNQ